MQKTVKHDYQAWLLPENVLGAIQTLALIFAGMWGIFIFVKFEEAERSLQAELLKSQNSQAELSQQIASLELLQQENQVRTMQSARHAIDQSIEIQTIESEEERNTYLVTYEYAVYNTGDSAIEVTYIVVYAYIFDNFFLAPMRAMEVPRFGTELGSGWEPILDKGYYYGPHWKEGMTFVSKQGGRAEFLKGGGGTSELDPSERSVGDVQLLIRAEPGSIIGFEAVIGINGGKDPVDRLHLRDKALLLE